MFCVFFGIRFRCGHNIFMHVILWIFPAFLLRARLHGKSTNYYLPVIFLGVQGAVAAGAVAAMAALATKQLLAIRDPHTDDTTLARLRNAFAAYFQCTVCSSLYPLRSIKQIAPTLFLRHLQMTGICHMLRNYC
eukprot:COSAG05_NODE_793_length_7295_cov_2.666481_10_plen_134_part_00